MTSTFFIRRPENHRNICPINDFKILSKSLSYVGPKTWYIIPTEIKNTSSSNCFQKSILKFKIKTYQSPMLIPQNMRQCYQVCIFFAFFSFFFIFVCQTSFWYFCVTSQTCWRQEIWLKMNQRENNSEYQMRKTCGKSANA